MTAYVDILWNGGVDINGFWRGEEHPRRDVVLILGTFSCGAAAGAQPGAREGLVRVD